MLKKCLNEIFSTLKGYTFSEINGLYNISCIITFKWYMYTAQNTMILNKYRYCSKSGAREQTNEKTSFIDAGVVYGDSVEKWAELADAQTGKIIQTIINTKKRSKILKNQRKYYMEW